MTAVVIHRVRRDTRVYDPCADASRSYANQHPQTLKEAAS